MIKGNSSYCSKSNVWRPPKLITRFHLMKSWLTNLPVVIFIIGSPVKRCIFIFLLPFGVALFVSLHLQYTNLGTSNASIMLFSFPIVNGQTSKLLGLDQDMLQLLLRAKCANLPQGRIVNQIATKISSLFQLCNDQKSNL